jgi:hypothetical protein
MDTIICFLKEHADIIGAVVALLTVVALVLAVFQTLDLKSIIARLASQTKRITSIADALPTQDIGQPFPGYVKRITELLRTAQERIVIVCDAPCYCIFSDPDLWLDLESALKHAKGRRSRDNKPSISILWMDADCRRRVLREQFSPGPGDTWKSGLENDTWKSGLDKELNRFLRDEGSQKTFETVRYKEFEDLVEAAHVKMIDFMNPIPLTILHRTLPLYFWIVDEQAIFAIPNYKNRGEGRAFQTRDGSIVKGLQFISERLRDEKELEDGHPS